MEAGTLFQLFFMAIVIDFITGIINAGNKEN